MKNKFLYIAGLSFAILSSSCSKEFLEQTPTDVISAKDLEEAVNKDPGLLSGNIAGLYTTMINTGTGGTTGHDDFGQKGYDIYSDMLSGDLALMGINFGWYSGFSRLTSTIDFTSNVNYIPWRYYYRLIFAANTVIDALGGNDAVPEGTATKHIMGQAKAVRAYAYFYLANLYSREGYGTGQEKILPLYLTTTVPNQPKSTSEMIYNQIVADLTIAIDYLKDFQRTSKDQVNKYVAESLLAYALAARGTNQDLQQVITLTDDVINNSGHPLTTRKQVVANLDETGKLLNPESGFNDVNTASWIWGVDLTQEIGLNLISWWGQMDVFTYSYAYVGDKKGIDESLLKLIPNNDIRKKQFFSDYTARNKFFAPARTLGGTRYATMDYVYIRADEMVVLNAEAKARLNRDQEAITSLKRLLDLRLDDTNYLTSLSGQALKNEILKQTRIEFWGEGKSYLSMKRNKLSVKRGTNHLDHVGTVFPFNADEITLDIPQAEILNNPNLNN